MAGTYVVFECCGSCLLSLDLGTRLGFLSISPLILSASSFQFCSLIGFLLVSLCFLSTSSLLLCSLHCLSKQLLKMRKI